VAADKDAKARDLAARLRRLFGGLDVLINNSGDLLGWRKLEELDLVFWQRVS